jgi:hypothetical protein
MKIKAAVMKRVLPLLLFLSLPAAVIPACDFSFVLHDSDGAAQTLRPGTGIVLEQGNSYDLEVTFTEDHGRCLLTPEDTEFYLEEVKWKPGRDLPLVLEEAFTWESVDAGSHRATLSFRAGETGSFELEILRECSKGGYDEMLLFTVGS